MALKDKAHQISQAEARCLFQILAFLFFSVPSFRGAEYIIYKDEFSFNKISPSIDDSENNGEVINFIYSIKNIDHKSG